MSSPTRRMALGKWLLCMSDLRSISFRGYGDHLTVLGTSKATLRAARLCEAVASSRSEAESQRSHPHKALPILSGEEMACLSGLLSKKRKSDLRRWRACAKRIRSGWLMGT